MYNMRKAGRVAASSDRQPESVRSQEPSVVQLRMVVREAERNVHTRHSRRFPAGHRIGRQDTRRSGHPVVCRGAASGRSSTERTSVQPRVRSARPVACLLRREREADGGPHAGQHCDPCPVRRRTSGRPNHQVRPLWSVVCAESATTTSDPCFSSATAGRWNTPPFSPSCSASTVPRWCPCSSSRAIPPRSRIWFSVNRPTNWYPCPRNRCFSGTGLPANSARSIDLPDTLIAGRKTLFLSDDRKVLGGRRRWDRYTGPHLRHEECTIAAQVRIETANSAADFLSGNILCRQKCFIDIATGTRKWKTCRKFVSSKSYAACSLSHDGKFDTDRRRGDYEAVRLQVRIATRFLSGEESTERVGVQSRLLPSVRRVFVELSFPGVRHQPEKQDVR